MRRRALALLPLLVVGAACSSASRGPTSTTSTAATSTAASSASTTTSSSSTDPAPVCAERIAAGLTPSERVGQLLMVGLDAGAGASGVDTPVRDFGVGGVILLGGWTGAENVSAATKHLNSLATGPGLFLAADQEGGQVQQLRGAGFTAIPSAQDQAAMGAELRGAAEDWGAELTEVGINLNLSPVADTVPATLGTANGPIGRYHREYGATPAAVIPPMTAFLRGMHDASVMTAIKHFPGIGRIRGNTDTAATGITDTQASTTDPFLQPFAAGIEAGSDFVMISSAIYPKIAAGQALFSSEIVTDLLRTQMGFDGVVITDDVGAAAAVQAVPIADRATRFIAAGGDVVLTARPSDIPVMHKAVTDRIGDDPAFRAQVDAAVLRILTLKARYGLLSCSG